MSTKWKLMFKYGCNPPDLLIIASTAHAITLSSKEEEGQVINVNHIPSSASRSPVTTTADDRLTFPRKKWQSVANIKRVIDGLTVAVLVYLLIRPGTCPRHCHNWAWTCICHGSKSQWQCGVVSELWPLRGSARNAIQSVNDAIVMLDGGINRQVWSVAEDV